ncbi:MAG: pimeloyl-ACP methyl ester carboxylesterase [Planctomycetota bacterium]|jgi:pimeloyl-ACP methyl ester carboxylesterase
MPCGCIQFQSPTEFLYMIDNANRSRTLVRPKARPWGLIGLSLAATAAFIAVSCSSLPKDELEQQLGDLGKNAALGDLKRVAFRADLGEGPQDLELIYHHAPAQTSGDSVPVVLVHGTPSTLFSWTELIYGQPPGDGSQGFAGLSDTRDVYAIEIIGHGMAPGDASPYSFERCARFVTAAIQALELDRVHLVGSSYGGEFAWRAALNEPELFETLALFDSSGLRRRDGEWLSEEVAMRENSLAKIGWRINSRDRIESALVPHFREVPPDRVEEFFLVCENAHNWKAMVDLVRDENGGREAELSNILVTTLILWGAEDVAYPIEYYGQGFADAIPLAELVSLPNAGHYPHEERPEEVVQILSSFLDKQRSTR